MKSITLRIVQGRGKVRDRTNRLLTDTSDMLLQGVHDTGEAALGVTTLVQAM